jgi:long-chain fatty acid transport protein
MRFKSCSLIAVASLFPAAVFGLGIRLPDQDAVATARGEAFVATADNPSAIYYNPAGIAFLTGQNARIGVYAIDLWDTFSGSGVHKETKSDLQAVPHIYYTYTPEKCPVSAGFGIYAPYGLGLEWPDNSPFRNLAKEGRIQYLTFNPVVAWKIHDTLSISAGPTINYSEAELKRGVFAPGDEFKFKGDDTAVGFNAGLMWRPHPQHSFGVNYRSATTMGYGGHSDAHFISPGPPFFPAPVGTPISSRQSASASFDFPQNVAVGWSFRPTPKWNLEFNVDWTDWDTLNTVKLKQALGPQTLVFDWRSSFFYEWGVTRYFDNGWSVSAGYIYSENSVPEKTFNPIVPDSDRHIFSIGVGKKYKSLDLNLTYQFAYGPTRTIDNPLGAPNAVPSPPGPPGFNANGRYEYTSHAVLCTIGYQF